MSKPLGLYVHFPFCKSKCAYCDFASYPGKEAAIPAYLDRLTREMAQRRQDNAHIATLYIGGGTPSLLSAHHMADLLAELRRHFSFAPDAECSCECNPGTVTKDFLRALKEGGVNRLSFGAQAGQDRLLRLLGRIHVWAQVEESVGLARDAGFRNVNLDLMLGLPTQTIEDVRETLEKALALSPTHLSCYGLIVEEGTPLQDQVAKGEWTLPEEETERGMYDLCRQTLFRHGFLQYEISNFALPSFACRHNVDCWKRKEYVGLGCAACGFLGKTRYQNPRDLNAYLRGDAAEETLLSPADARFESVMLGLRMTEGVSEADFQQMHGVALDECFGPVIEKHVKDGLLIREKGHVRLSRRGMDIQNRVLVDFL